LTEVRDKGRRPPSGKKGEKKEEVRGGHLYERKVSGTHEAQEGKEHRIGR